MTAKASAGPRSNGLVVVVLDANPQTRNRYLAVAVTRALGRHPRVAQAVLAEYDDVVALCRDRRADLLLVMGGAGGFAGPILRAAAFAKTSVLWTGEDPYELPANLAWSSHFDLVCTNDAGSASAYGRDAIHLPYGASRDFHAVEDAGEPLFDVLFVGTAWPNRVALLDQLIARLPDGLRLKFGLSGNASLPGWHLADPDLLTGFRVAPHDFAQLAARSRLVLTLDRDFSTAAGGKAKGSSPPPRLFEIGLVGTPQIYLAANPLDPRYYKPGQEIAVASSVETAAREIERLLGDDEARRQLGAAARVRTQADHLYEHRVETIFATLDAGLATKRERWQPAAASRKKRVLAVAHNIAGIPPIGGVELYQTTLMRALPDFEFVLFASSGRRIALTIIDASRHRIDAYPMRFLDDGTAFDPQRERIFHDVLLRHEIDLVHVQHLMHHSWAYPMIARMLGVPVVATAHDYHLACTRFNLIGVDERFCGIDTDRTELCDVCLKQTLGLPEGSQARRREVMGVALGCFDRVLFNTPGSRDLLRRIYPDLDPARCEVVGMTGDPETLARLGAASRGIRMRPDRRDDGGRLHVAVVGNLSVPKGGALLVRLVHELRRDAIVFDLHGRVEEPFAAALAAMPNVVLHGEYQGDDLAGRLSGQVLSLHLSVWPETYCITLDEVRAAGLVPVVLGYGALAERVRDGLDGYVVDPDRPEDLVGLLRRIRADPALLDALVPADPASFQVNHDRHVAAMRAIYNGVTERVPVPHGAVPARHARAPSYTDLRERFNADRWDEAALALDDPEPQPRRAAESSPVATGFWRTLWRNALRKRPPTGAQGHLDTFAGRHDSGICRVVRRDDLAELRLGGWLVPRDKSAPFVTIEIRLVGTPWQVSIAAIVTERADVAAQFDAPHLAMSGFVSLVELACLPEGGYAIEIHGCRPDGGVDVMPAGTIRIV